ncbi:MAG TPA: hypothetical protein VH560_09415 [Polyangia bacterium]|jgi:hypothetical protein|nr:hypothetical protein [Polyangia bacterium]
MTTSCRAALIALAVFGAVGCDGGGGAKADGAAGRDAAGDAADGAGGRDAGVDAARDSVKDVATDFGAPTPEVMANCPLSAGTLAPAATDLIIDDFAGTGLLDGRIRSTPLFNVKEQFDATPDAHFNPAPAIDPACGAAGAGAAHVRGTAADTGATFAIIFSSGGDGGKPADHYDASGTKGITFRAALGAANTSMLFTLQLNAAGSPWDYTKDVVVKGTTWQDVQILWSDLEAAPAAPAFTPATLNQIVFPFAADADVDLYVDDIAFVK